MGKLGAIAKLTRIEHSVMLMIAVIAAELIVTAPDPTLPAWNILLASLLAPALISAGSFAINDYYDVKADRANKRFDRPLVSGELSRKGAFNIAIFGFVVGVLVSALINWYAFLIALVFAVLAYLYSYRLKDTLLYGNLYIALSASIPFIFGNFVVSSSLSVIIVLLAMLVFLANLAREIHGMIRDRTGDARARNTKNLISKIGVKKSAAFAFILYAESIAIGIFLIFFRAPFRYNLVYIVPMIVASLIFVYVATGYTRKDNQKFYRLSRNLSLSAMGIAVLGYLVAALLFIPV